MVELQIRHRYYRKTELTVERSQEELDETCFSLSDISLTPQTLLRYFIYIQKLFFTISSGMTE